MQQRRPTARPALPVGTSYIDKGKRKATDLSNDSRFVLQKRCSTVAGITDEELLCNCIFFCLLITVFRFIYCLYDLYCCCLLQAMKLFLCPVSAVPGLRLNVLRVPARHNMRTVRLMKCLQLLCSRQMPPMQILQVITSRATDEVSLLLKNMLI